MDSITTALKELEQHGYLTRQRLRYENGQLGDIEYTIHEKPVNAETDGFGLEKRQAPMGMVLNTEPEYAELTYAGEIVEVTQTAAGLYDERQKAAVDLHKSLETDEFFGIGLGEEFQDISFGLYAASDLTVADGSFAFEEIPYGHWIIAEISAPELYTVSQEQHHVYIGEDGQQIEIRIDNTLIRGCVQV